MSKPKPRLQPNPLDGESTFAEGIGHLAWQRAYELYPICRSLTGPGTRETLRFIQSILPDMVIQEVPTGTQAFDWIIPDEWEIRDAFVADEFGNRVVDFRHHNLHVIGYSEPIDRWVEWEELDNHLFSLPEQPDAIPYVTSYYERNWGFCIQESIRKRLDRKPYRVFIDSQLAPGHLSLGELIIPGDEDSEVLLSTYVCHPSMANNELSGPVVQMALAEWLYQQNRRHTYRILFLPETIGAIFYLSEHLEHMKRSTIAGFVLTCLGDDRVYSLLKSRCGGTLADRVAENVLRDLVSTFDTYSFLDRGSDERQYCSPGVDLPVCSVMRSKYETFPEYHTSLDNMDLISPAGLEGSFRVLQRCLQVIEGNYRYTTVLPCEPQLGKRNLYPNLSQRSSSNSARSLTNLLAYADGTRDLIDIADIIGLGAYECMQIARDLEGAGLLRCLNQSADG